MTIVWGKSEREFRRMTFARFDARSREHNWYHGRGAGETAKPDPWATMQPGTYEDYLERHRPGG